MLLFAISGLAFVAPMLVAWVLARRRVPGRGSSLAVAGVLTLVTAVAAATLAVSMVYQFGTLPLAAALLLRGPTGRNATPASSSPGTPTVAGESIRRRT